MRTLRNLLFPIALLLASPATASECDLWDRSFYFQSTDSSLVDVTLVTGPRIITTYNFSIPRSYIVSTGHHRPSQGLPEKFETSEVLLRFAYPDGAPTTVRTKEMTDTGVQRECKGALSQLRETEYYTFVRATSDADAFNRNRERARSYNFKEQNDEFEIYTNNHLQIYVPKSSKTISYIQCSTPSPRGWCQYFIYPKTTLRYQAMFADFRSRGGATFVNERTKRLFEIFCELKVSCDEFK